VLKNFRIDQVRRFFTTKTGQKICSSHKSHFCTGFQSGAADVGKQDDLVEVRKTWGQGRLLFIDIKTGTGDSFLG
jgi:hypothetical protein